jgi:hypothetical protein
MYTVRNTYEKSGADVLLEAFLGPIEPGIRIFADPLTKDIIYYRSEDRSYAEMLIVWDSEESYREWDNKYKEIHADLQRTSEKYYVDMEITFHRLYPPTEDHVWELDPRIAAQPRISYEQIFE